MTIMRDSLDMLFISVFILTCSTMLASAGCSSSCGTMGGTSFNFLGDPSLSGMSMDFQDIMRSQSSVTVGSKDKGEDETGTDEPQEAPAPISEMGRMGNWSLKMAFGEDGANTTEEGELRIIQSGEMVFGKGWVGDLPITAGGSAAYDNLTIFLVSLDGKQIYRLDLIPVGGNLTGNSQVRDALGKDWSGTAVLSPI